MFSEPTFQQPRFGWPVSSHLARLRAVDKGLLLAALCALILGGLVISPLLALLVKSFSEPKTGALTLANYVEAFTNPRLLRPYLTSFQVSLATGALAVLIGTPMAWAISRTDMPYRGFIRVCALGSFIMPPFLGAMCWILLASPNAGLLNKLYRFITGAETGLFNVYSMPGLVFVLTMYTYPFVLALVSAMLQMMGNEMEDAANILGARTRQVLWTITLPLALPAILGGFLLTFLDAMAIFGSPRMLAVPARQHLMTTQLATLFTYPPNVELAAAYSMPLLLVTAPLLWLQRRIMGRKSFTVVTGKGSAVRVMRLGVWRTPVFALCLLVVSLSLLMPFSVLLSYSFLDSWGRGYTLENLTLANYQFFLHDTITLRAVGNSLGIAGAVATVGTLMTAAVAYVAARRLLPGTQFLTFLATVPFVVPGIVMAVGIFAIYTRQPIMLYGTIWILFVAYLTKLLPLGYTNTAATIQSIHPELEEAARILGATRLQAFKDVMVPLIRGGLLNAWILLFVPAMRELSSSVLLFTSGSMVLAIRILEVQENGKFELAAVIGTLLVVLSLTVVIAGRSVAGREVVPRVE